jgi:anti-sigma regulatory factor (Ser/Thr protein kinase)
VLRRAASGALPADRLDDAALATSEAINNAVLHAYRDQPPIGTGPISVRIWVRETTVEVLVADRGVGFVEGDRAPTTGLGAGLRLIEMLADETQVLSDPKGTVVVMRFGPRRPAAQRISPADAGG